MSENSANAVPEMDNTAGNANIEDNSTITPEGTVVESGMFAGKSMSEVERMYLASQAMIGKQGTDIGSMRADIAELQKRTTVPVKSDEQIAELMTENPVLGMQEMRRKIKAEIATPISVTSQTQTTVNPEILQPDFKQWAEKSGMTTWVNMATKANDTGAIDSLISSYKATKQQQTVQAATVAGSPATTGIAPKSKFKFTQDQIDKMPDVERERRNSEILQAYQNGLVG